MNEATIKLSENMQGIMGALENLITDITGERLGFALMVFTPERASYGSNCLRAEVVEQMKDLLALWEAGMPDIPAHEVRG